MDNIANELVLYKYISFSKFVDLIENERLYLTRVNLWEDTHEGAAFIENYGYGIPKDILKSMGDQFNKSIIKNTMNSMYAQSWTHSKIETDAMWRIYSTDKLGVRIEVKAEDVRRQINNKIENIDSSIELNDYKVEYGREFNPEDIRTSDGIGFIWSDKEILRYKRKAFSHEEEYRFSFTIKVNSELDQVKGGFKSTNEIAEFLDNMDHLPVIYYNLPNIMIKEVILDPRASKSDAEMFTKYCENKRFREKNINFRKSNLYDSPINKYL